MKVLCDVCEKGEASVFCVADEAALCVDCDRRVHHANKLAGKHQRFSIEHPSAKESNLCDICKERKAFLFCQQDRAILCRDCDVSIHKTNKHTQMHTRLMIGPKVSATPCTYISSLESASAPTDFISVSSKVSVNDNSNANLMNGGNISNHLIEALTQWQFEDYFLDYSFPASFLPSKEVNNKQAPPLMGAELQANLCSFTSEELGFWVPQSNLYHHTQNQCIKLSFGSATETKENLNKRWSEDCYSLVPDLPESFQVPANYFTVPNAETSTSKRPRFSKF